MAAEVGFDNEDDDLYFPKEPEKVRKHLDDGALYKVTKDYLSRVGRKPKDNNEALYTVQYKLILLAACAMQLGCILPVELRDYVAKNYRNIGLQCDGIAQMQKALGDYKDGTPYDFESKSLIETANSLGNNTSNEDRLFPESNLINVTSPEWGPGHKEMMQSMARSMRESRDAGEFDFPANACGNCGTKQGIDGGQLKHCARRQKKLYCGKGCQAAHWPKHKKICKPSE